jgi:aspartate/methionine/tyrosine aminotransferase
LTYNDGPYGLLATRKALANLFNKHFAPVQKVDPSTVIITSGVTAAIDALGSATTDDGDGYLLSRPIYTGFTDDLIMRNRIRLCAVSLDGIDPMAEEALERYEEELQKQVKLGVKIRGIIFCK